MSATVGIERIRVALLDAQENVIKKQEFGTDGIFDIDAETSKGATQANITGLAPQTTRIWGSNKSVAVSSRGSGQVSVTIGANSIPANIVSILTGMKRDEKTGAYVLGSHNRAPYAVMEAISTDEDTGKPVHFAVLKGMFAPEEKSLQTNNENEQRTVDQLTFTGINRISDELIYANMFESDKDTNLDEWNKFVFPQAQSGSLNQQVSSAPITTPNK